MKTIKDLEKMKRENLPNIPFPEIIPFKSQYDLFLRRLEDYYIGKLDGVTRIKAELKEWDEESKAVIVHDLASIISESGIGGFDIREIIS